MDTMILLNVAWIKTRPYGSTCTFFFFATVLVTFFAMVNPGMLFSYFLFVCNSFLTSLTGSCIGTGALTSYRPAFTMPLTTVTTDVHQSFNAQLYFSTQFAFGFYAVCNQLANNIGLF